MKEINGVPVYEDVILNFTSGSVYYVEKAYVGSKSINDYEVFNTPYLLGKREELIISCDEFNENSQFRWTIPISSLHENTDTRNGIVFENIKGEVKVLRIDQLRCRHISDLYFTNGSFFKYKFKDDFMNIVIEKITKALPKTDPYMIQMNQYNLNHIVSKVSSLEARIEELEKKLTTQTTVEVEKPKSKRKSWTDDEKMQFLRDYRSSIEDTATKYGIGRNTAISYNHVFSKDLGLR